MCDTFIKFDQLSLHIPPNGLFIEKLSFFKEYATHCRRMHISPILTTSLLQWLHLVKIQPSADSYLRAQAPMHVFLCTQDVM